MRFYSLCLLFCLILAEVKCQENQPKVSTTYGDVVGESVYFSEDKYLNYSGYFHHFKGIPYASPPVGDLRFRPPETAAPWPDVYDATYFRSDCPQRKDGFEESLIEDCLYLNVLVPATDNLTGAAVMVWIHGGQYSFSSGADARTYGIPLLAAAGGDVIYVTLNYRLGVLGFMTTGDEVSPGNYGLMDQRMALKWVKENIQAFGGDPEKVTIFGVSAGAGSVSAHLLSSSNCELFQRAILQSGSMFESSSMIELNISRAIDLNKQVASIVGCETESPEYMVKCLRNASVDDIITATKEVEGRNGNPRRSVIIFYPVIDGDIIPDNPLDIVKRGEFKKVDIMLGINEDATSVWLNQIYDSEVLAEEEPPFINKTRFRELLQEVYPQENSLYIDSIEQEYTDWPKVYDPELEYNYIEPWIQASTDELYQCPTDITARVLSYAGQNVFRYVNTHVPSLYALSMMPEPEWHGVSHLQEMPFVFGFYFNPLFEFNSTEEERQMSVKVMRYWTNFAKTGNPNTAEINVTNVAEPWPAFTLSGLEYKELSPEMENDEEVAVRQCAFWHNYLPKVALFTDDIPGLEEDWRNSYYDWKYVALDEWQTVFDEYKAVTEPCT